MNKTAILSCLCCFFVATTTIAQTSTKLPDLPDAITSFGAAATADGHLYVYGGHKGDAHHYNIEGQSNAFRRLNLKNPGKWEDLPSGPRLQGLALVTDGTRLFRVGGFTAMNKGEEDADLRSQNSFAMFEPMTNKWTELTPLPNPRSSFDAVVHKNQLFVVGGWDMQPNKKTWAKTALVADLKASPIVWKKLPDPPFQRRALSLAALGDSIYSIGGMKKKGGPTKAVSVFNTKTGKWSEGPELPGEDNMAGFGSSSFAIGNRLFASTYEGKVLELARDGKSWQTIKSFEEGRFFHRMVPMNQSNLLLISGANMSTGKYEDIIVVPVQRKQTALRE